MSLVKKGHFVIALKNKRGTAEAAGAQLLQSSHDKLCKLIGAASIEVKDSVSDSPVVVTELGSLYLDLSSSVDVEAEKKRLTRELGKLEGAIRGAEAKLGNEKFTGKAPAEVVAAVRETLESNKARKTEMERLLSSL